MALRASVATVRRTLAQQLVARAGRRTLAVVSARRLVLAGGSTSARALRVPHLETRFARLFATKAASKIEAEEEEEEGGSSSSSSEEEEHDEGDFLGEEEDDEDSLILYPPSSARVGEFAPEFVADAVVDGKITKVDLLDYLDQWIVLLFYPKVRARGGAWRL